MAESLELQTAAAMKCLFFRDGDKTRPTAPGDFKSFTKQLIVLEQRKTIRLKLFSLNFYQRWEYLLSKYYKEKLVFVNLDFCSDFLSLLVIDRIFENVKVNAQKHKYRN